MGVEEDRQEERREEKKLKIAPSPRELGHDLLGRFLKEKRLKIYPSLDRMAGEMHKRYSRYSVSILRSPYLTAIEGGVLLRRAFIPEEPQREILAVYLEMISMGCRGEIQTKIREYCPGFNFEVSV